MTISNSISGLTTNAYLLPLKLSEKTVAATTVNCPVCPNIITDADKNIRLIIPQQTHTSNVGIVTDTDCTFPDTDALITQMRKVAIGVRTADCVPLLLYAPDIKAIAAIHAGWKGTLHGIVDNTVKELLKMGASSEKLIATFGVAVCGECYEVDNELADLFVAEGLNEAVIRTDTKPHIDLIAANTLRLQRCGISIGNITRTKLCTRHSANENGTYLFHSWRRNPGTQLRNYTFAYLL